MTARTFTDLRAEWRPALLAGLTEHVTRLRWSAERIRAHQRDRLRALLGHAVAHSPFHRARLGGVDPERFELEDLARLPVMTKPEMMDRLDDVFTDRELTAEAVERALAATDREPVPIHGRYVAMASGGSSGRRGVFVLDRDAGMEYIGSLARPLMARLLAAGGPPPGGLLIPMVCAASAVHATGTAPAWTAAGDLPFRFLPVPVTLPPGEIVERLNAIAAPMLYGYASMLARLAAERRAGRLRVRPQMIVSTSETLRPEMRADISDAFGAPVVDTFGSTEGLVGHSAPGDSVLVFNSDVCIVELVDADDRPVPDGVPSKKIVVTNLANRLQPLIRYEIGDSFVRRAPAPDHGHLRAIAQGRSDEVLRYDRVEIHPLVIRSVLVTDPAVLDYQVRQTRRGVEIIALAAGAVDVGDLGRRIASGLGAAGLADPEVTVRTASALDRDPKSGKIRRVIPVA
jgi:phenylacetate-coenzyme A ligase PaaK-like adenylate-forming protein